MPIVIVCGSRFGLGLVAYQQEYYQQALSHFSMASKINGASSVILTHVGLVSSMQALYYGLNSSWPE